MNPTTVRLRCGLTLDMAHDAPPPGWDRFERDSVRQDIAHALAELPRYAGHTEVPWSVADHSMAVAWYLERAGRSAEVVRAGLLHDAHEGLCLGDIPSPTGHAITSHGVPDWVEDRLKAIKARLDYVVADVFAAPRFFFFDSVAGADRAILGAEMALLRHASSVPDAADPLALAIVYALAMAGPVTADAWIDAVTCGMPAEPQSDCPERLQDARVDIRCAAARRKSAVWNIAKSQAAAVLNLEKQAAELLVRAEAAERENESLRDALEHAKAELAKPEDERLRQIEATLSGHWEHLGPSLAWRVHWVIREVDEWAARAGKAEQERSEARRSVTELQARMTEMVEAQLHRRVATFYAEVVGRPFAGGPPQVPEEGELLAKLRLVVEECMELVYAAGYDHEDDELKRNRGFAPDLVQIAGSCAGIMSAVQGLALACGIHLPPVIDEVHRSDMAKVGGQLDARGKFRRPGGWTPPDIAGVLREQGWAGPEKTKGDTLLWFVEGEWVRPYDMGDEKPWAMVWPSTPRGRWLWFALNETGEAPTQQEAQDAAVAVVRKVGGW